MSQSVFVQSPLILIYDDKLMKIYIIMNISSILQFYRYDLICGWIQNISDIKFNENYENLKKTLKNYLRINNIHFKFIF